MNLFDISVKSLVREKLRAFLIITAIVLGAGTVTAIFNYTASQRKFMDNKFDEYGANIIILPQRENLSLSYGGINVSGVTTSYRDLTLSDAGSIRNIPNNKNIRAVSYKLLSTDYFMKNNTKVMLLAAGVDFNEEHKIKPWWHLDPDSLPAENEIIIGANVSVKIGVKENDTLNLFGDNFTVKKVIHKNGDQDDDMIYMSYNELSKRIGREDRISLIEVSALCYDCPIEIIVEEIQESIPDAEVSGIKQIMMQKMDAIERIEKFAFAVMIIIVFITGMLIFTTMLGAISERTGEIGLYRAVGYRKSDIITIILTEVFLIILISILPAVVFGIVITYLTLPVIGGIPASEILINYPGILMVIPALFVISITASLYPAFKASEIDPVLTLKTL